MRNFYSRERGEYVLEEEKDQGSYRWATVEPRRVCSGQVNPTSIDEALQQHARVLDIVPYALTVTPLDCESLNVMFGFDFTYRGNHNQLLADALGVVPAFERLAEIPGSSIVGHEPSLQLALDAECRVQCRLNFETRTSAVPRADWRVPGGTTERVPDGTSLRRTRSRRNVYRSDAATGWRVPTTDRRLCCRPDFAPAPGGHRNQVILVTFRSAKARSFAERQTTRVSPPVLGTIVRTAPATSRTTRSASPVAVPMPGLDVGVHDDRHRLFPGRDLLVFAVTCPLAVSAQTRHQMPIVSCRVHGVPKSRHRRRRRRPGPGPRRQALRRRPNRQAGRPHHRHRRPSRRSVPRCPPELLRDGASGDDGGADDVLDPKPARPRFPRPSLHPPRTMVLPAGVGFVRFSGLSPHFGHALGIRGLVAFRRSTTSSTAAAASAKCWRVSGPG